MKTTINQRIEEILNYFERGSKKLFAEKTSVPPSSISGYIGKRQSIPGADFLERIAIVYPRVNCEWLVTGEGEMLKKENTPTEISGEYYKVKQEAADLALELIRAQKENDRLKGIKKVN